MAADPGPRAPVLPPVALPPARSLLTAVPPSALEEGAAAGVSHVQGRVAALPAPQDWCSPGTVTVTDACGQGNRNSFLLIASELRPGQSTFAANRTTYQDRRDSAVINLELHRSYAIAKELLYGAASQANTWGNPYLTDSNLSPVTLAAQPYNRALDRIQDLWGDRMQGERGLLHVPPSIARALYSNLQIIERGNQLVDPITGNQIVTDAAYAQANTTSGAEDPLDQVAWIFMSPNIDIRLSEVVVFPGSEEDMRFAINRSTNVVTVFASQVAVYTYEQPAGSLPNQAGNPPVLGIPVDLCTVDCLPGAS